MNMSSQPEHLPLPTIVIPRWIRQAADQEGLEEALFSAGAALALIDPLARAEKPISMLWRKRLALSAATATATLEGRREDQSQLRDAVALCRPGDDPGPAGRMLLGWRALGEARALRAADWPDRLPKYFDLPADPSSNILRDLGTRLVGRTLPIRFAAGAAHELLALGTGWRAPALWLADAALAQSLGWERPVPLIAPHLPRMAFRLAGDDWLAACARAWSRGALAAWTLFMDLSRRAAALQTGASKLRGKDTPTMVEALLQEDALSAQAGPNTSDRAARRLFERLTALGLVRELTGRSSFRLYGL